MNTIIIVEKNDRMRDFIHSILLKCPVRMLGSATDGFQALLLVEQYQPDMIVINTELPVISGAEVLELLNKRQYSGKILFITPRTELIAVQDYLGRGAAAMMGENNLAMDLPRALDAVLSGYAFFPRQQFFDAEEAINTVPTARLASELSTQEHRVLHYLLKGFSNNEIAKMMTLSNKTVSTYKVRILQKNQAKNIVELMKKINPSSKHAVS